MPKTSDERRHWRLSAAWPAAERERWLAGTAAPHPLDIPKYGQLLAPASLATIERAYGRYLCWLEVRGDLVHDAEPEARITPGRVAAYLRHLDVLAYSGQSTLILLSGLRAAMRILAPQEDWRWITKPAGVSVLRQLKEPRPPVPVPTAAELYLGGLGLIERARTIPGLADAAITFRDGLAIALLTARPLRIRTFSALQLNRHILRTSAGWRLVLEPQDMKNRRALEFNVPESLIASMNQYVDEFRTRLMKGSVSDFMWISSQGHPMTPSGLDQMIRRRAKEQFGIEFGPHRFRHAMATSAAAEDSDNPGLAPSLLAIGARMVNQHYDRTAEATAARVFQQSLTAERNRLAGIGRRVLRGAGESAERPQELGPDDFRCEPGGPSPR